MAASTSHSVFIFLDVAAAAERIINQCREHASTRRENFCSRFAVRSVGSTLELFFVIGLIRFARMNKTVIEVQVRAVLPTSGGCAVFLGNNDKVFIFYVDQT